MELLELLRQPTLRMMDLAPIALAAAEPDGRVVYANPALCRLFDVPAEEIVGHFAHECVLPEERARLLACIASWRNGEARVLRLSVPLSGGRAPFLIGPGPLLDSDGRVLGLVCAVLPARRVDAASDVVSLGVVALARDALRAIGDQLDAVLDAVPNHDPALADLRRRVPALRSLSDREWEVARRVAQGERTALVAEALGIRTSTVRNHLKAIFKKTGVGSQAALVGRFRQWRHGVS